MSYLFEQDYLHNMMLDEQWRKQQRNLDSLKKLLTENGFVFKQDPRSGYIIVCPDAKEPFTITLESAYITEPQKLLQWVKDRCTISNTELWDKASKAAYNYRLIYNIFPNKIGIHMERMKVFDRTHIIFPVHPVPFRDLGSLDNITAIAIQRHTTYFEGIAGPDILWDEVYLPHPKQEGFAISGDEIAALVEGKS